MAKAELFKVSEPKWKKAFSRTKWILSSSHEQGRHYGLSYAFFGLLWWIGIYGRKPHLSVRAMRNMIRHLDIYLENKYSDIIKRYSQSKQYGEYISVED